MNHIKNIVLRGVGASTISGIILSGLVPLLASGQGGPSNYNLPGVPTNTTINTFITTVICVIAGYMFWILIALTVVFVIVAAYRYLFSAGDPSKISGATRTITFAAVSIIVALMAKALPTIVASIALGGALPPGPVCP